MFLNIDGVNLQDIIPRKDLGKKKEKNKGGNFDDFIPSFGFTFDIVKAHVEDV